MQCYQLAQRRDLPSLSPTSQPRAKRGFSLRRGSELRGEGESRPALRCETAPKESPGVVAGSIFVSAGPSATSLAPIPTAVGLIFGRRYGERRRRRNVRRTQRPSAIVICLENSAL